MAVKKSTEEFNKKWIHKRDEMKGSYKGYYWGLTIVGIIIVLLLVFALLNL